MAINRYTRSSRFTDKTSPPPINGSVREIPSKEDRIRAQKAKNKAEDERYEMEMAERASIISERDKQRKEYEADLAAYEKKIKDTPSFSGKRDYSMMGGRGIDLSEEGLKRYVDRQREMGNPIPYRVERPAYKNDDGSLETEEEFLDKYDKAESGFSQSYFRKPIEPKYANIPEPKGPNYVTEEMYFKGIPALRNEEMSLRGLDRDDYEDPNMPGKPTRLVRKQFKGSKIKGQKGKPNLVERAKIGGDRARYRREGRLAKSTFGRGFEDMGVGELDERKAILKERKREQMSPFKRDSETNKITGLNRPQLFKNLAVNQSARREIRDINRAKRYSDMVGGEQRVGISDRSLTDNQKKGGPKYFDPDQMKGYRDSTSNPLNRNRRS